MRHLIAVSILLALAASASAQGTSAPAQTPKAPATPLPAAPSTKGAKTKDWKIQNAMSAAPRAIAKDASVMDYPEKEGGEMAVLRKGTNDWTCLPDDSSTPGNDPMCLDRNSMAFVEAWMSKKEPRLAGPGIGYMLQGGTSASNTDPHAKKPAAGEKWMKEPAHIMVFPTGKLDPNVYGTDPHSGRPWIMWAGTPYEHLMIPLK